MLVRYDLFHAIILATFYYAVYKIKLCRHVILHYYYKFHLSFFCSDWLLNSY